MLSLPLILEAASSIHGAIRRTPLEESPILSELVGVPVWLKLENEQITGSFKARGALFSLLKAKEEGLSHVATCSAGNHGKGVAWVASRLGMTATIFVPSGVDSTKYAGMVGSGADVRKSEFPGYDDTERWAKNESIRLKIPFISAFDDYRVMAANGGTVAMEIFEELPSLEMLVLPVGGGGLSAGAAFFMKEKKPDCQVVVCQHEGSPAFQRSIEAGKPVLEMPAIETLASGLEGGFGRLTFEVLKERYDRIELISEAEIRKAMVWTIENHQLIIEGSSAVTIAACLRPDFDKPRGPIVLVVSGRNVAAATIVQVLHGDRF